jgi:N-acetylneuraminic acid mutarotase
MNKKNLLNSHMFFWSIICGFLLIILSGCNRGDKGSEVVAHNCWTWVSGESTVSQGAVYGIKGLADPRNKLLGRQGSVSWTDSKGNLWIFGGVASHNMGEVEFNDLWKFDGRDWTWVSGDSIGGDSITDKQGIYGTKGVAAAKNKPGARQGCMGWIDTKDNLWIFGGLGYDSKGAHGYLNDLWKFDGTNWTWVSGDDTVNQSSVYGAKGATVETNKPGARQDSAAWIDSKGNLWLFGGQGYKESFIVNGPDSCHLSDLWKFDGTNWTWISGDSEADQPEVYGEKGVAASSNKPGARQGGISWIDRQGNIWLFGGYRSEFEYKGGFVTGDEYKDLYLNDLWKFDGASWTWVSGDNIANQAGVYGAKGIIGETNKPGARQGSICWIDSKDNLWLFGGLGYSSVNAQESFGFLNDLWRFDGSNWIWMSGDSKAYQSGTYGTKGIVAATNKPGGRQESVSWIDRKGDLCLFGGQGCDGTGERGSLNDLWKFDGVNWTWISGDGSLINKPGNYGTKGVAADANNPYGRHGGVSWIDKRGNLWLFGGLGDDNNGTSGNLNDLWKFDGNNWTWISGDNTVGRPGVYGVYGNKGVPAGTNKPGARRHSISWIDRKGNLWLFGGQGAAIKGYSGELNDLWEFDGSKWTWVSGDNTADQAGAYGEKGIAAATNKPGAREGSVSWVDKKGNFWLFGGAGYDSKGSIGELNDLWRFDGSNWTWVTGDNTIMQSGIYGENGVPASANKPGARQGCMSWIDSKGNLWLFGGYGYEYTGDKDKEYDNTKAKWWYFNDLWKFDGINWTWVSGDNIADQPCVYGVKGVPAATNKPGARQGSVSWIDSKDNLWLFGGYGNSAEHNDLWKFDGVNWTWVSGDNEHNQSGVYNAKGVPSETNKPGAREDSVSWIDNKGDLWLFGGGGHDAMGDWVNLNDLWKFEP